MKLAIEEKKEKQKNFKTHLITLTESNEKLVRSLPKYEERVEKLESCVSNKKEEIERNKEKLIEIQKELQIISKVRIQQLIKYIFPIKHVQPKSEMVESSEAEMVSALAEATHTTYIKNQWVYTDNSSEYQHSIVAPCLPGSGNYAAYNHWG